MKDSIKTLIIVFICLITGIKPVLAQNSYLAEIGVHSGASSLANRNSDDWKYSLSAMSGLLLRYNLNERIGIQLNAEQSGINGFKGSKNTLELNSIFNMLELGKLDYKLYSQDFSPYIFSGLGLSNFEDDTYVQSNLLYIPLGIGLRVKLKNRFNLNIQLNHRFFPTKNKVVDGVYPAYNIIRNNTNTLNNSQLSSLSIGITYDFWRKACDCMKESVNSKR